MKVYILYNNTNKFWRGKVYFINRNGYLQWLTNFKFERFGSGTSVHKIICNSLGVSENEGRDIEAFELGSHRFEVEPENVHKFARVY
jgi:hypothetical protein